MNSKYKSLIAITVALLLAACQVAPMKAGSRRAGEESPASLAHAFEHQ